MRENRPPAHTIDPARIEEVKTRAVSLIEQELADDRELHDAALACVEGNYEKMAPKAFANQLRTICLVLTTMKQKPTFRKMQSLLADLLRGGIYKIQGAALDAVTVKRDVLQVKIEGHSTFIGSADAEVLTIVSLGKESRETERQLAAIEQYIHKRSRDALRKVSDRFQIPLGQTQKITEALRDLFENGSPFTQEQFEPALELLTRQGNHAFQLLWCYFKALKEKANRIAFLNALQHLISRIDRPKHALRFLLADFCRCPDQVATWDRNAIMLANVLLRTYNKELGVDIEMTPEEVLNVRNGLDPNVVRYAQFRIDSVEYRFAAKIRTIHSKLTSQLGTPSFSIDELILLEREILIFLSLLSGKTAHAILTAALTEYGDPEVGIYRNRSAVSHLPTFLQHLIIVVRGVSRVGTRDDLGLLKKISQNKEALAQLNGSAENQRDVVRVMEWVDNVIRGLSTSNLHPI